MRLAREQVYLPFIGYFFENKYLKNTTNKLFYIKCLTHYSVKNIYDKAIQIISKAVATLE